RDVLLPLVADVLAKKSCAEWMGLFVKAAIPCGPVNDMQSLFADPQLLHREMLAEVPHPTIGALRLAGIPVKYSKTPGSVRLPPPLLGEHTEEILEGVLGYDAREITELRAQGAF
ncbi:MAG: CoA transferase, partial [Planctomycetota bacterium]